jgi:hypothetical protein
LRSYGRLPQGRENRGRALTNEQIVAAVLGLVAAQPRWAGHVATIIAKLKPVGANTDTFGGAVTLMDALSQLLSDKSVRRSVVAVRVSVAEAGTNSHGLAVITYERKAARHQLSFVREEAVSLLQPGAETKFDPELRNAPISRELVFTRRFFERLAQAVDQARAHPTPPTGDGSEYDKDDAERARRELLGATPSSQVLNIGVDNQVTWPRNETLVKFDRYKFVLMPKTAQHVQSITCRFARQQVEHGGGDDDHQSLSKPADMVRRPICDGTRWLVGQSGARGGLQTRARIYDRLQLGIQP